MSTTSQPTVQYADGAYKGALVMLRFPWMKLQTQMENHDRFSYTDAAKAVALDHTPEAQEKFNKLHAEHKLYERIVQMLKDEPSIRKELDIFLEDDNNKGLREIYEGRR